MKKEKSSHGGTADTEITEGKRGRRKKIGDLD